VRTILAVAGQVVAVRVADLTDRSAGLLRQHADSSRSRSQACRDFIHMASLAAFHVCTDSASTTEGAAIAVVFDQGSGSSRHLRVARRC